MKIGDLRLTAPRLNGSLLTRVILVVSIALRNVDGVVLNRRAVVEEGRIPVEYDMVGRPVDDSGTLRGRGSTGRGPEWDGTRRFAMQISFLQRGLQLDVVLGVGVQIADVLLVAVLDRVAAEAVDLSALILVEDDVVGEFGGVDLRERSAGGGGLGGVDLLPLDGRFVAGDVHDGGSHDAVEHFAQTIDLLGVELGRLGLFVGSRGWSLRNRRALPRSVLRSGIRCAPCRWYLVGISPVDRVEGGLRATRLSAVSLVVPAVEMVRVNILRRQDHVLDVAELVNDLMNDVAFGHVERNGSRRDSILACHADRGWA